MRAVFNQEVSLRRSVMNEAVFNAQDFFVSRQTLLKSLVLSAVPEKIGQDAFTSVDPQEEMNIRLSSESGHWSIWLTQRMMEYLRDSKVNLLYVPQTDDPKVVRLFDATMQEDLAQAESALRASNTSTLVSYLHRINGSLATVGAKDLAAACNASEVILMHEPLNPASAEAVEALLKRLHAVVSRMVEGALHPKR